MDKTTGFLKHHGIKGQRWGIRRKPNLSTGRVSTDFKVAAPLRQKHVSELTNKQLKVVNERANLEQNFQRLNPSERELRKKKTKEILALVGVTSVAGFVKSKEGRAAISAGSKFIQKNGPMLGRKISNIAKSQLVKRSAKFAVKQRIKNI